MTDLTFRLPIVCQAVENFLEKLPCWGGFVHYECHKLFRVAANNGVCEHLRSRREFQTGFQKANLPNLAGDIVKGAHGTHREGGKRMLGRTYMPIDDIEWEMNNGEDIEEDFQPEIDTQGSNSDLPTHTWYTPKPPPSAKEVEKSCRGLH